MTIYEGICYAFSAALATLSLIHILVVIVIAGILVIYNIFYISIINSIKEYGPVSYTHLDVYKRQGQR